MMEVFRGNQTEWEIADPEHFTGNARLKRITWTAPKSQIKIFQVQFKAEARTNWHRHSGPQLLFIIDGCCQVQKFGNDIIHAETGDVVHIAPNEKHWHGAAPGTNMTHIAVNIDATTTWLEPVTQVELLKS